MDSVSTSEDAFRIDPNSYKIMAKQISKTEVHFFHNRWLDTSAITLLDLGLTMDTY